MRVAHVLAAGVLLAAPFSAPPSVAQVEFNICGAPPLPPCGPRRGPREYEPRFERDRDFGRLCRTRFERCRVDPRPIGARCICLNDDDEEVVGRIVR
jgi:hypothetical protein